MLILIELDLLYPVYGRACILTYKEVNILRALKTYKICLYRDLVEIIQYLH